MLSYNRARSLGLNHISHEAKEKSKKDLNRNRGMYFVLGLLLALALTFAALEWKTYHINYIDDISMNVEDELVEDIPINIPIKTPPPPPPVKAPPVIEVIEDDEEIEETVIESSELDQDTEIIDVEDVEVAEEAEILSVPFSVIEDAPVFLDVKRKRIRRPVFKKMMQKHINKVFRYPEVAQEMGIQGRVNVIFDIEKDGSINNIRMRGPDKNLEKEAERIIKKLPKMTPGKQRGKAVKVPFSVPIVFKLQ